MDRPPEPQLVQSYLAADDEDALQILNDHAAELLTDAAEATLEQLAQVEADPDVAEAIRQRLELLRAVRQWQAEMAALPDQLVAWVQTPDWEASQLYLQEHAAELLTDAGAATLDLLLEANPGNEQIEMHIALLARCRELGIDAAYAELRGQMEAANALRDTPLLRAVVAFLQAEDEAAAQALLEQERSLLLTLEAGGLIEQFLAAARQNQDGPATARLEARLTLWQRARQSTNPAPSGRTMARAGKSRRRRFVARRSRGRQPRKPLRGDQRPQQRHR